jgi:hypothetical protein
MVELMECFGAFRTQFLLRTQVRLVSVVVASFLLLTCSCTPQVVYLSSSEKVYRVPSGSIVTKPDGSSFKIEFNGYVISDGTLIELYRLAKQNIEENKIDE